MSFINRSARPLPQLAQPNDEFYKFDGDFISKIQAHEDSVLKCPTNKISLMLIPDYSQLLAAKPSHHLSNSGHQARLRRKSSMEIYVNPNFQTKPGKAEEERLVGLLERHSYITRFLWDNSRGSQVQSRRHHILDKQKQSKFSFKSLPNSVKASTDGGSSTMSRSQRNSFRFCISNRQASSHPKPGISAYRLHHFFAPLDSSRVNRDTNVDVWYSRGLKHGSNVLRFGLRNKNIALIVHHDPKMAGLLGPIGQLGIDQEEIMHLARSCEWLNKSKLEWSEFIRSVNKKCTIVHLYIKESQGGSPLSRQGGDNFIDVSKIESMDKEYIIKMDISAHGQMKSNSGRLLLLLDHLLDEIYKDSNCSQFDRSYSGIFGMHSRLQGPLSTPIRSQPSLLDHQLPYQRSMVIRSRYSNIQKKRSRSKSIRNPQDNRTMNSSMEGKFHLRHEDNESNRKPTKGKKLSVTSKELDLIVAPKKPIGSFNFLKFICCSESSTHRDEFQTSQRVIKDEQFKRS